MTRRGALFSTSVRVVMLLVALGIVLAPMVVVALVWGPESSVDSFRFSWSLMIVVVSGCVFAFLAGAFAVYLAGLGKDLRVHAAFIVEASQPDVNSKRSRRDVSAEDEPSTSAAAANKQNF